MTFYITILLSWAKNELEAGWSHFFIGFTGFGFTGEAVMGEALPNGTWPYCMLFTSAPSVGNATSR